MKNTDKLHKIHTEFKPSIFKEGMRQLKIGGIVYVLLCAIFTIFQMLDGFNPYDRYYIHSVSIIEIGWGFGYITVYVLTFMVIFTVSASLVLMNFLRSGKARDFYCSTPNSISTLWISFTTAVFTWAVIGIGASAIVELPFMLISDFKMIGLWFSMLISMLSLAFFFCGIVMLAINLTGRIIPAIVTAVGIALLPSMLWLATQSSFLAFFGNFNFISTSEINVFPDVITSLYYISSFNFYSSNSTATLNVICSASAIVYNLVLGAIYIAIAAFFATIRTGDAAGKPFVNKAAHFISLMVVSVDIACLVVTFAVNSLGDRIFSHSYYYNYTIAYDIAFIVVFSVIAIFVMYWLCELLLTFDIKKSRRAFKFMPIPFVVAIALAGAGYLNYNEQFSYAPSASEVESFTLVRNEDLDDNLAVFRMNDTFGRLITNEAEFKDEEVINYVTREIKTFTNMFDKKMSEAIKNYSYFGYNTDTYINIKLNLKNGKSITRAIRCNDTFSEKLAAAITSDSEFMSEFLELPDEKYTNITLQEIDGLSEDDMMQIYESFKSEYNAMSNKERLAYLKQEIYSAFEGDMYYWDYEDTEYYWNYEDAENTVSNTDIVSYTDIEFESIAKASGEYEASGSYYPDNDFDQAMRIILEVSGYKDGKFYNNDFTFEQSYTITPSNFPKTMQLIIKICNNNLERFTEIQNKLNEKSDFYMKADYCNGKDEVFMNYSYVNKSSSERIRETGDSYYSFSEEYTDEYGHTVKVIKINNVSPLVDRLFEDAANSDEIDMSKPFAKVNVSFSANGRSTADYTIFVQTESPIDVLNIELLDVLNIEL